ncbi:unnamed protein product [Boreogadus saida]
MMSHLVKRVKQAHSEPSLWTGKSWPPQHREGFLQRPFKVGMDGPTENTGGRESMKRNYGRGDNDSFRGETSASKDKGEGQVGEEVDHGGEETPEAAGGVGGVGWTLEQVNVVVGVGGAVADQDPGRLI